LSSPQQRKSRIPAFAGMTGGRRKNQSYRHLTLPE
jgi:hypothetical protein